MGITVKSRLLQAPCPATLIDRHHAMRLRVEKAGLDVSSVGTASEEDHEAFEVTMYGGKFHWPLLRIPTQVAQVGRVRQEDPATFVRCHSYSILE